MTVDPCTPTKPLPPPSFVPGLVTSVACGAIFGYALQKGHVFEPEHVFGQMTMTKFIMIKLFLSAAATSLFSTGLLHLFPYGRARLCGARKWLFNAYRGLYAGVIGGMIAGFGIALSGACPGTILAQIGSGVRWAPLTIVGAFAGAAAFSFVEPRFLKPTGILNSCCFPKAPSFDTLLGMNFTKVAWIGSALFGLVAFAVEKWMPWRVELANEGIIIPEDSCVLAPSSYAWPPLFAGVVIGLLQIPLVLVAGETLGASRSYVTVYANVGHAVAPKAVDANAYLTGARTGLGNWSQVLFVLAALVGSYISVSYGGGFATSSGFTPLRSLVGGFFIVFGARMAGGCTSGQGLSGNAILALISPVVTASMFGGGMITAAFIK